MTRIVIAALTALMLSTLGAAAAAHHKHHVSMHARPHGSAYARFLGPGSTVGHDDIDQTLPGYVRNSPNECYTDDGYGRYQPCDNGGSP
jgi:hypothetical protein